MDRSAGAERRTPAPFPELTDELIDAALERARRAVCGPLEARCYAFRYGVDEAKKCCTANGRCAIGWLTRDNGRQIWEAWLDLRTGEGPLRVLPERAGGTDRHGAGVGP